MNTLLSLGHGYSAQALARLLIPQGWRVIGTTRSAAKAQALRAQGGDPVLLRYGQQIAATPLHWVGYLSTTAVYGDHKGAWVDETTALTPGTARGAARVAAEQAWSALGLPLHIFRLAGIYGPGRGPFEMVRA